MKASVMRNLYLKTSNSILPSNLLKQKILPTEMNDSPTLQINNNRVHIIELKCCQVINSSTCSNQQAYPRYTAKFSSNRKFFNTIGGITGSEQRRLLLYLWVYMTAYLKRNYAVSSPDFRSQSVLFIRPEIGFSVAVVCFFSFIYLFIVFVHYCLCIFVIIWSCY